MPHGTSICYHDPPERMMSQPPYLTYSDYLLRAHGCIVYRVAVDAGFGCPNRSGGRDGCGCTYCAEEGARAPYLGREEGRAVAEQVSRAIEFLSRRYGARAFILYFQAFSNTNAPAHVLARTYDSALSLAGFRGLHVATRPDCLDEEKARLLAGYRARGLDVWVELGLQSAHDRTLRLIRRGHTSGQFLQAYRLLKEHGLKVAVHLILGLPGESAEDMRATIDYVARLGPDGVKIHNLHVPAGTPLARELLTGEITTPGAERHIDYIIMALELLPPDTVIMRLTCDTPRDRLLSPRRFPPKATFLSRLASEMRRRNTRQGRLFRLTEQPPSSTLWPGARQ